MKLLLALLMAFCPVAMAQQPARVPDTNDWVILNPEFASLNAPESIRTGTRLTYLLGFGSIAGDGEPVEDPQGNLVDPATGKRYVMLPADREGGGAGMAYQFVDLAAVSGNVAAIDIKSYSYNPNDHSLWYLTHLGAATHAGANDWFIHPDALRKLLATFQDPNGNTRVVRLPYPMEDGKTYQAIRIQTKVGSGSYTAYTFDEQTGYLLRSVLVSQKKLVGLQGGQYDSRRNLQVFTFKGARQLNWPWMNAPLPQWTNQVQQMQYRGSITTIMPNAPQLPSPPIESQLTVLARGQDWLRIQMKLREWTVLNNMSEGTAELVSGRGSVGGLFIPPAALGQLQVNQVLDQDPITRISTVVSYVGPAPDGRAVVGIAEVGNKFRADYVYETQGGMLIRASTSTNMDVSQIIRTVDLVGTR